MLITYYDETIAEVESSPMSIDVGTLFGKPAIVLRGIDPKRSTFSCEYDSEGLRNLDVPQSEDVYGVILFPEGRPAHGD